MHDIPHAVLSERFQELMRGQRLKSAVFLTYCFEPDFFEQEVLPVVLDIPLSHVSGIRLLQLEDALKARVDHIAVYYDRNALMPGEQSAKLDVRRIPVSYPTGYFHPKNVLLLTESAELGKDGKHAKRLVVAAMSANLTKAGWWENVEACHIEIFEEEQASGFRDDLLDLIRRVRATCAEGESHDALDQIRDFVRHGQQRQLRSANGVLHPRLFSGGETVSAFLQGLLQDRAVELCLEIISPFFDKTDAKPLKRLQQELRPRETRVFLPRADDGAALCEREFYDLVNSLSGVVWAQLPADLTRSGKGEQLKRRRVHAKVYRFFHPRQRYEAFLIGSVNLTSAAHEKGGNFEAAFFVENIPGRVPDWWLTADNKKPLSFLGVGTEETSIGSTALSIRFNWARTNAAAYWDSNGEAGDIVVSAQGAALFSIDGLGSREWTPLSSEKAQSLKRILTSTSFLDVTEDGGIPATILVQEEGMAQKPSLLYSLSAADILRYWALLTPEQRAAFFEERLAVFSEAFPNAGLETARIAQTHTSIFDSFAGVYHAFGSLERAVLDALDAGRTKEAEYRLLGQKYDSLPHLLDRVLKDDYTGDTALRYVIVLCAKQLVRTVKRLHQGFRDTHRSAFRALDRQIANAERIREEFSFGSPEEREAFLVWFDEWFVTQAHSEQVEA
jgi:hypothetical protein